MYRAGTRDRDGCRALMWGLMSRGELRWEVFSDVRTGSPLSPGSLPPPGSE